jgi:hypothetical protein
VLNDSSTSYKRKLEVIIFELIATYLRIGISKMHGKYLDNVLNIIAENELEV